MLTHCNYRFTQKKENTKPIVVMISWYFFKDKALKHKTDTQYL